MNQILKTLRTMIETYFSLNDLKSLAFDFGLDADSLHHSTKPEFVIDLINHFGREGKLTELVAYLKEERKGVAWPDVTANNFEPIQAEGHAPVVTHIHGDINMGDKITMSGDFRGAIVNMKSTMTAVQQSIGGLPHGKDIDKADLTRLIEELAHTLEAIPLPHTEALAGNIDAVVQISKSLVDLASEEKLNNTMLVLTGDMLKMASNNLVANAPTVVRLTTQIVTTIHKITGVA